MTRRASWGGISDGETMKATERSERAAELVALLTAKFGAQDKVTALPTRGELHGSGR